MKRLNKSLAALILAAIIILSALAGCLAGFGVGKEHKGKASHILLGLDLAGGVSITYEAQGGNPSDKDMNDITFTADIGDFGFSYEDGSDSYNLNIPRLSVGEQKK